jgi:predicted porin
MNTAKSNRRPLSIRRSPWVLALACALGLQVGSSAASAQVLIGDGVNRPSEELMIGQTVYTQPSGSTQLIVGASQARTGDVRNSHISARGEYGVTDRFQVQGEVPLDITDRSSNFTAQSGISRFQVGASYALTAPSSPIAVTGAMDIEAPLSGSSNNVTGDRPSAGPTYKPQLIAAMGSGPVTVHANAQAELGQPSRAINYNVGSQFSLGSWVPSLEMNARSTENQRSEYYVTPGVTYKFSDRAELGAGVAVGLNDQSQTTQLMAKFNMRLP